MNRNRWCGNALLIASIGVLLVACLPGGAWQRLSDVVGKRDPVQVAWIVANVLLIGVFAALIGARAARG